jgi:hypothetical protein
VSSSTPNGSGRATVADREVRYKAGDTLSRDAIWLQGERIAKIVHAA